MFSDVTSTGDPGYRRRDAAKDRSCFRSSMVVPAQNAIAKQTEMGANQSPASSSPLASGGGMPQITTVPNPESDSRGNR